jgi:hypothetical protein
MGWALPYTLGVLARWKMAPAYCEAVLAHEHRVALSGLGERPSAVYDVRARENRKKNSYSGGYNAQAGFPRRFDRMVAFDAETTGKRTRCGFHSQAAVRVETAGYHHRGGFCRDPARRHRLAQGRDVVLAGQPGRADRPRGHRDPHHCVAAK